MRLREVPWSDFIILTALPPEIKDCESWVVLSDDSANDHLQRAQEGVQLRFRKCHIVSVRYYSRIFIGHSTFEDIQEKAAEWTGSSSSYKIIHI